MHKPKCVRVSKGGYIPLIVDYINRGAQFNCQICGSIPGVIVQNPKYLVTERTSELVTIYIVTEDGCRIRA